MDKNPYVRLRELCGMSQKKFADKYKFGKMTMVYLESGMYTRVSDRQNVSLGKECAAKGVDAKAVLVEEYGTESLNEAYLAWRSADRKLRAPEVLAKAGTSFDSSAKTAPLLTFVSESAGSLQGFCKLLKVPSITVTRYIRGLTASMPEALREALVEIKYPHIDALEAAQNKWIDGNKPESL